MGVRRWRSLAVLGALAACLAGCGQRDNGPTVDVVATAAQVKLPGATQPCTQGAATDRCSTAKVDARAAAEDVTGQLRALGLDPKSPVCEKVTEKMPEQCTVQVVVAGPHALTFIAFPHALPTAPLRFDGVDTVILAS